MPLMPTLSRYALLQFLQVFLLTLVSMSTFMLVVGVAREALEQGIGVTLVYRMVPYLLPNALLFTVPGATLFAASVVYGRMSAHNELLAVTASGINPWGLIWPVLVASFLLSLATVWLNDVAWTWGFRGVQRVILESGEEVIYGVLRTQRSYRSKQFSISVQQLDDNTLLRPTIVLNKAHQGQAATITAERAWLRADPESLCLLMVLENGVVSLNGVTELRFHDRICREISLSDLMRKGEDASAPSHMTLRQIFQALEAEPETLRGLEERRALEAAEALAFGDFAGLAGSAWSVRERPLLDARSSFSRLRTEMFRRWANGFSCLCFALVGIPVAIGMKRAGLVTSFFICFLPILLVYYPLMIFGVDQAKNGTLPAYFVLTGDVVLAVCGLALLWRLVRR